MFDNKDEIWITDRKNKFIAFISIPLLFLWCFFCTILHIIVRLKIKKFVYLRFKGGIISISKNDFPNNNFSDHENIKFE